MNTTNCTICGEEKRPQLYHDPYTCRACRAGAAIANEIDAARGRQESPAYVKALLVCQALVSKPELATELGY